MFNTRSILPLFIRAWVVLPAAALAACGAPSDPDLIAVNTFDGEDYRVVFMTADGDIVGDRGCPAIWAYAARGGTVYAVDTHPDEAERGGYAVRLCAPYRQEFTALLPVRVYDSHAGFGPGGRIVTAVREAGRIDLVILGPGGEVAERLTDDDFRNSDPDWSPDGRTILFRSTRGGSSDLWTMDVESRALTQLTANPDNDGQGGYGGEGPGRYSPDGSMIAWSCTDDEGGSGVCVMNADGSEQRRLTPGIFIDEGLYPSWRGDGRAIFFGQEEGEGYALYEVDLDGGPPRRIDGQPDASNLGAVWVRR